MYTATKGKQREDAKEKETENASGGKKTMQEGKKKPFPTAAQASS
jgi:hypothetical protein